jgi:hypothetical protein
MLLEQPQHKVVISPNRQDSTLFFFIFWIYVDPVLYNSDVNTDLRAAL